MTLCTSTWRALLQPRRALPLLAVVVALVLAQAVYSGFDPMAIVVGVGLCGLFVVFAPASWRWAWHRGWMPVYVASGVAPAIAAYGLSSSLVPVPTFLTSWPDLVVVGVLYVVGGWGLGRDIELEEGLTAEQQRTAALAREAEHAQLLALRAHLDPHFLFNTLNAIAEWCVEDGEVAEQAILDLSAILREVLGGVKQTHWPLARELEIARKVLELHRLRDPDRFTVEWEVPDPAPDVEITPLLLLPLVENAVKHGPAAGHRGPIRVTADAQSMTIENPGPFGGERDGGHGLASVRSRAKLDIGEVSGPRTRAVLTFHP